MRFKKFRNGLKKGLLAILLSSTLVSCSSFFKTKEVVLDTVVSTINDDGDVVVTFTFVDNAKDPLTFIIPQGKTGNGIKEIIEKPSEDGLSKTIKIVYTDESIDPLEFVVNDGVSIVDITSAPSEEEENLTIVTITLSNGEVTQFEVQMPKDGKDGTTITGVNQEVDENDNIKVTVSFSDLDDVVLTIPAGKKGEDGKDGQSISGIFLTKENDQYIYTFKMNDNSEYVLKVERPATWLSGDGYPQRTLGIIGDYYYDREWNIIYIKTQYGWEAQFYFDSMHEKKDYTITFDFNAPSGQYPGWEDPKVLPENKPIYKILEGHTIYDTYANTNYKIPTPFLDGYTFAGWYTSKTPDVNSGKFNEFVSVFADMTLYAQWVQN